MKSFNQNFSFEPKQDMHQNHQMYMSNGNNHNNNFNHHIQGEINHIDNSNCQQLTNLIIIQPQYAQYDYAPTPNDYSQSTQLGSQINTNDFNSTLPIMDVDSFVANLSNLEEVQYCIDSHSSNHQNHLLLPTQLQNIDNLSQHNNNQMHINHNKLNYEDYSLSNLEATTNINVNNYSINILESNSNDNLDAKINDKLSKVDILNQVILNASNTQSHSNNKMSINDFSTDHIPNHYYNHNNHSMNVVKSKKTFDSKLKFKQKDSKICCNVCGHKSSGYHYGSHTCEACKLFFRRTEKQIRKTGFNECKTKNCKINYENRANCSACRYKKCIAVGMGMSRSRFGRHTEKLCTNYAPNIAESLCTLMNNLKLNCYKQTINLEFLNNIILDFYFNALNLLAIKNNSEEEIQNITNNSSNTLFNNLNENTNSSSLNSSSSYASTSTLSELSTILKTSNINSTPENSNPASYVTNDSLFNGFYNSNNTNTHNSNINSTKQIILPDCVIILFCVFFGINIDKYLLFNSTSNFKLNKIISDYEEFIRFTEEKLLKKNKLMPLLRIGLFIKIMRLLLESKLIKEDLHDKRITDLMRSEFALFKYDSNIASTSNSSSSSLSNDLNDKSNDTSSQDYFGQSCLVLIFTNINHLLFKHMNTNELDYFVFKRCVELEF